MNKEAKFYHAQAAKMRECGKTAPTMRTMFEDIAIEYEKLAQREEMRPSATMVPNHE